MWVVFIGGLVAFPQENSLLLALKEYFKHIFIKFTEVAIYSFKKKYKTIILEWLTVLLEWWTALTEI